MNFSTYLLRRFFLMIPTFLGITILSFGVIQLAPGGPIENYMANLKFGASGGSEHGDSSGGGGKAVTAQVLEELKKQYGFDKPIHIRYLNWLKDTVTLDFGYSHTFGKPVLSLIASKFPVSLRFGITSLILTYLICIPLGILKAMKHGSYFDYISSFTVFVLYSIFPFMLAILLIVVFAGKLDWFPLGGIMTLDSDNFTLFQKIKDQLWHMVLPLACFIVNDFAILTILMKNSIIEEVGRDYVRTARAKGLDEKTVIVKHAFRNALIPIATGFGGFIGAIFASNLLLERIFNLDGFGKLFYDAALQRDYPVLMAQVVIGAMLILCGQLISDIAYVVVDPRIDFASV